MDARFADRASFREALATAARQFEARVQDGPDDAWTVTGGTPACANPNAAPWKAVATLAGDAWGLSPVPVGLPWNRRRAAGIAAVRTRQLEDLIRSPRPLEAHERFPFTAGRTVADRAEACAWIVAGGALAMALTLVAVTLASMPLLEEEIGRLYGRAEVLTRIGADPLPRQDELDALGVWGRLGSAFLLAVPIAFFLGGLHAAVNAGGSRWVGLARFAPWCLIFIGASSLLAFIPRMPLPLAFLGAALVPGAAFLGTSLCWGRLRDETSPQKAADGRRWILPVVAVVVVIAGIALLVPTPGSNDRRIEETARFRDRVLLESGVGRALSHFYYRYTLYAAEPVRPVYALDDRIRDRQVRTALMIGQFGSEIEAVRAAGFFVERAKDSEAAKPLIAKRQHDVYFVANSLTQPYVDLSANDLMGRTITQGIPTGRDAGKAHAIPVPAQAEQVEKALDAVLRFGGLEGMLLELTWLGWTAVFYAGPLFVLLLASIPGAAIIAWLFRRFSPRGLRVAGAVVFLASVGGLIAVFAAQSGTLGKLADLRRLPADDQKAIDLLSAGLGDAASSVRYEAAYRSYFALKRATFPRGALVEDLRKGLRDESVRVRLWCAAALGLTRVESARPDLFRALDDPDMLVRYRAAEGLENLDAHRQQVPAETLARLKEMMKTRSWYEGMYALDALKAMNR